MIAYRTTLDGVEDAQLTGFFEGWPNPPSPATHRRVLEGSAAFVLAFDEGGGEIVGFVTALSDGVLSAYIPLLEVKASRRGDGIGRELVRRVIEELRPLYMIDLSCDPELESFYSPLGFRAGTSMMLRDYEVQAGPEDA